jgi:hypothetical protein
LQITHDKNKSIEDQRVDANKEYELSDIIFLTMAAVLCAKGWKAIEIFEEPSFQRMQCIVKPKQPNS